MEAVRVGAEQEVATVVVNCSMACVKPDVFSADLQDSTRLIAVFADDAHDRTAALS